MKVYILKHPNSGFSEHLYGVTFNKGIGSTSSERDAQFCIQKGCKDVSAQYEPKVNEKTGVLVNYVLKKKGKGKGKTKDAPDEEEAEPAEPEKK